MKQNPTYPFLFPHARTALFLALSSLASTGAWAQTAPDAGRTLQQQAPVLEAPKPAPDIRIAPPAVPETQAGGVQVSIQSVNIRGNTLFSSTELLALLGQVEGQSYDLAGLRGLAEQISDHYHQAGYPFARAYLPAQALEKGVLTIEVLEGKYGQVKALGDDSLALDAQPFLNVLHTGEVIESAALERATLILDDQPGIKTSPLMRPGQLVGTGDLDIRVERTSAYSGELGLDNQGNRYTGQTRMRFNLDANSPFILGDQITVRGVLTEENMWFGNLGYSLPVGGSGLRAQFGYSHTYYELGGSFSSLQANGTADVASAGLSYPLIRSQRANLTVVGTWQHKNLQDKQGSTGTNNSKSSDSLPLGLNFDLRDGLAGGGITYGNVTWTTGQLSLDSSLLATDRTSARTAGNFNKINLDVARIQVLSSDLNLYGRFSGQWADKNLDSSERFGLGGPSGVRAYPVGEGYGDDGWLAQVELRYAMGAFSPYVFYDAGWIKVNEKPWTTGTNDRSISGPGFGLRYQEGAWNMEATLAWRDNGGKPQSDTRDSRPRGWFSIGYKF
jgi:hemolysin activation/secretion protein